MSVITLVIINEITTLEEYLLVFNQVNTHGISPDYSMYCYDKILYFFPFLQPVVCGSTLIVSPVSIADQWLSEIDKHIKPGILKVLVSS